MHEYIGVDIRNERNEAQVGYIIYNMISTKPSAIKSSFDDLYNFNLKYTFSSNQRTQICLPLRIKNALHTFFT
jgi:hypothetical protein